MLALSEMCGSTRFLWELTCRGGLIFICKSTTAPLILFAQPRPETDARTAEKHSFICIVAEPRRYTDLP